MMESVADCVKDWSEGSSYSHLDRRRCIFPWQESSRMLPLATVFVVLLLPLRDVAEVEVAFPMHEHVRHVPIVAIRLRPDPDERTKPWWRHWYHVGERLAPLPPQDSQTKIEQMLPGEGVLQVTVRCFLLRCC